MAKYWCKVIKTVFKKSNLKKPTIKNATYSNQSTGLHKTSTNWWYKRLLKDFSEKTLKQLNSSNTFIPHFRDGLCVSIIHVSLKSKMFQLFALSIRGKSCVISNLVDIKLNQQSIFSEMYSRWLLSQSTPSWMLQQP